MTCQRIQYDPRQARNTRIASQHPFRIGVHGRIEDRSEHSLQSCRYEGPVRGIRGRQLESLAGRAVGGLQDHHRCVRLQYGAGLLAQGKKDSLRHLTNHRFLPTRCRNRPSPIGRDCVDHGSKQAVDLGRTELQFLETPAGAGALATVSTSRCDE